MFSKLEIKAIVLSGLKDKLDLMLRAAMDSHIAAIDPSSKAESKYDTRSLEISYLANAQTRNLNSIQDSVRTIESFRIRDFSSGEPIAAGAVVELKNNTTSSFFLLLPCAGGLEVFMGDQDLTILSPGSPLFRELLGKHVGESTESPVFQIKSVC